MLNNKLAAAFTRIDNRVPFFTTAPASHSVLLVTDLQLEHSNAQVKHLDKMLESCWDAKRVSARALPTARTILAEALRHGCGIIEVGRDVPLDVIQKLIPEARAQGLQVVRSLFLKGVYDLTKPNADGGYAVTTQFSHYEQLMAITIDAVPLTQAG